MYIYQNDKLYVQQGDNLVGVEIHSNEVILLKTEKSKLEKQFELLTPVEVHARFQGEYKFPKKEVIEDDATGTVKTGSRKPRRK